MAIENLARRNKLSMLWIILDLASLSTFLLMVFDPNMLKQIIAGQVAGEQITSTFLLVTAGFMLLGPMVMAFASQTLKDSLNRWANMIVGAVYTAWWLLGIMDVLANPTVYLPIMDAVAIVAPALVVWYAYRWPKEVVQPVRAPVQKGEITV
ncbi:MAG: hypothetical protein JRN20_05420 [Nitrososphaerota archaeon]|nr:hypothetical protein [Nitrososphaerota archaeon]